MKTLFEKIIEWQPAFDKRHSNPSKNYGIHGMTLKFLLKGEKGATQFVIYTGWHLKHVQEELDHKRPDLNYPHLSCHPMPADLGYHSPIPMYEGQPSQENCSYLSGKDCYYDGSSLNAEKLYWQFVEEGDSVVWKRLEECYKDQFENKEREIQ